ncbi:MAG: hypothetical protein ACW98X_02370 [Promethearchaeota archaeon]|jgi:hypothetical protein
MGRLRIFSTPYGWIENINWLIKHLIIDIFYPFVIVFSLIIFYTIIPLELTLALGIFLGISVVAFIIRGIKRIRNRFPNIGKLNEDGWRENSFNELEEPIYNIGFVGDIMKMGKYKLKFEKRVRKFFKDVNLMVGNLEGIITSSNWLGLTAQKHDALILQQLRRLGHHPQDWLLCTSNNHSSDFGKSEFQMSNKIIRCRGYNVFGDTHENQNFLFKDTINLVSGTMWNNQRHHDDIAQFEDINDHYQKNQFNILFPHWHYENESYVRKRIILKSISLILTGAYLILEKIKRVVYKVIKDLGIFDGISQFPKYRKIARFFNFIDQLVNFKLYQKFNREFNRELNKDDLHRWGLIYGHHSHVPQPITNYGPRILAYSGGNFTSSQTRKKHISGLVMKCQIGQVKNTQQHGIGKMEWSYTINEKKKIKRKTKWGLSFKKKIKVDTVVVDCNRNRTNCFTNIRNKIWTNIIYIIIFSAFEFVIFGSIFNFFNIFRYNSLLIFSVTIVSVILIFIYVNKTHR